MKRIEVDPFDIKSIDKAIYQLNVPFRKWLRERVNRLCEVLAKDYALRTVADEYGYTEGGRITCTAEELPERNGWLVKAEGKGVCFIEYGTGPAAGSASGSIFGSPPPVDISPGSWSSGPEGKGTYQDWLDGGGEEELGPYAWTIQPRSGMYFAFRAATQNVQKVAEEVFRE